METTIELDGNILETHNPNATRIRVSIKTVNSQYIERYINKHIQELKSYQTVSIPLSLCHRKQNSKCSNHEKVHRLKLLTRLLMLTNHTKSSKTLTNKASLNESFNSRATTIILSYSLITRRCANQRLQASEQT